MKKLIIAAAIVCAAVVSQAASITWGTSCGCDGEGSELGDSEGTPAVLGWVFSGISKSDYALLTSAETIWNGFDAANNQLTINGTTYNATYAAVASEEGYIDFGAKPGYNKGDEVYAALVLTTNYKGEDLYSANAVDGVVGQSGLDVAQAGLAWGTIEEGMGTGDATTWQSVPEPTSGLLLLLGVAGLALRRRRA